VFGVSAQAPAAVRKVIYAPKEVPLGDAPKEVPLGDAPNALESVNAGLRKIIRTRGHFPSDDAATKLLWLVLRNITAGWSRAAKDWKIAMNQFAILYEERFTIAL
jgi:putative transposase